MERIGSFDVLGQLGRGGMGVVLHGRCAATGREVALKLLDPALLTADGMARFEREVAALTRMRHPGIVGVLDAGSSPHGPWVAMERIQGESLQARLDRGGPLGAAEVVNVGRALCGALAHAHGMGVLHRDVKPGNVLLARDGRVVLVDFGLARLSGVATRLTVTGEMVGTPCFMAPEQAQSEDDVGPLADVYAVGATLYAALTGRPPVEGAGLIQVLDRVLHHVPDAPSTLRAGVPPALSALLMRCLEKAPDRRPASVAALGETLERVLLEPREPAVTEVRAGAPGLGRRRGRTVFAAALVLLGAGAVAASSHARGRTNDALSRAEDDASALDTSQLLMRARAQLVSGDAAGALASAEAALRLAPDDLRAVTIRAGASLRLGRTADARADLERLLGAELERSHPAALSRRILRDAAVVAQGLGEHETQLALAERALALGPDLAAWALRVEVLIKLRRLPEAVEVARAALEVHPDDPGLLWNLAAALSRLDDWRGSLSLLQDGAARWPTVRDWPAAAAKLLEEKGKDLAGAEEAWSGFLRARPDDDLALRARGRLRLLRRDWDAAAADLSRLARTAPDDAAVWGALVEANWNRNARDELEAALDRVLALRPDLVDMWVRRGELRFALGRGEEGLADLDRALELDPAHAGALASRGTIRTLRGDPARGVADLERAVALAPGRTMTWANLGHAYLESEQPARALDAARRSLELQETFDGRTVEARTLAALGRRAEAIETYERALRLARRAEDVDALSDELERLRSDLPLRAPGPTPTR